MNAPAAATAPAVAPQPAPIGADATALTAALEALPVGVLALDAEGRILWLNDRACELCRKPRELLLGRQRKEVVTISGALGYAGRELVGGPVGWREVGCLVEAPSSRGAALVAELTGAFSEGRTDPVTGLLNHKALLAELSAQVSRSRRYGNPLSIMFVSLAFPPEADARTNRRVVAQTLRGCLRWVDYVGSWSDNEFLLILPETRLAPSRKLALKVTAEVSRQLAAAGCGVTPVVCSVAEWQKGDDAGALLERAAERQEPEAATAE